jgi:50S ribosomal protein L16 3-hydroxylase
MTPGLLGLLQSESTSEFERHRADNEAYVRHGLRTASWLSDITALQSRDALLGAWGAAVQAHTPDIADEASAVEVSPRDAPKLFANGMSLLFNDAERLSPVLPEWLDAIRRDLGLSSLTQRRCLVYATPTGGGTAAHFDQNVNFVMQLHGTKCWQLAPNQHVTHPLTRHTMGLAVDGELQSYARTPMPVRMPKAARTVELKPGSVLFVPPGMWHATTATSDALALNFTFTAPSWLDVVTAAMRGRLIQHAEWREPATPSTPATLDALLAHLAADVTRWHAVDLLRATETE